MRKPLVFLLLFVGACAKGTQAELPAIGQARSLAAEWALVNQQSAENKLTATYADTMRASIREQLQEAADTLGQQYSPYESKVQALLKLPDDASPQELRRHAERLKRIEDSLESA